MALHHILAFLAVIVLVVATTSSQDAVSASEAYWNSVLPDIPMPKSVSDLLQADVSAVGIGRIVLKAPTPNALKYHTYTDTKGPTPNALKYHTYTDTKGPTPNALKYHTYTDTKGPTPNALKYHTYTDTKGPTPNALKYHTYTDTKGPTPNALKYHTYTDTKGPTPNALKYHTYTDTKQVVSNNTDANVAVFFLERDLMMAEGKTMKLHFSSSTTRIDNDDDENTDDAGPAAFLPRYVANSIPFSSDKLPQIYSHFSVKPGSAEAEAIETTVKDCESPPQVGEEKHCATSLESMIDFTTSHMGYNVYPISTEVSGKQATKIQNYTIVGVQKMGGSDEKSVVCHKQNYVYAVYYCHKSQATRAYTVSMEGADGTNIKAVAICHPDTSAWDPNHMSFQVLHVKPGTFPICHFLPQHHLAWVTSN